MAFNSLDDLIKGMASKGYRLPLTRASLAGAVAGLEMSLWRGTGFPTQGAIPAAAAICSNATVGALPLAARTGTEQRIVSQLSLQGAVVGHTILIEDRLAHMGGLNGTLTTAQTVGINLHTNLATSNLAARIGNADYSEVEWYLEWYTATGATVSTPTAQVTFHDGTTGSVNIWALGATALPASVGASRRYKIVPLNGKYIRSVETVTLSASTATAGSFGVTAVRHLCAHEVTAANQLQVRGWDMLTAPLVEDNACVTMAQTCITTNTGATYGRIIQAVQ
jgi:hypothetical protein